MKAVIYARYSSSNQRDESIEGQLRECYAYAKNNDITVIGEYCDRAISGKTDKRPEFQRMIKDSDKQEFELLLLYTLDRFARNRYDSAIYKARLKKNGVKVIYVKQPISQEPEGIILESILEGYAEYYSENLSRSIKRGLKENLLHGILPAQPPLGYKRDTDRKFIICPQEAKIVREAFKMYADDKSITDIVKHCEKRKYKTKRGTPITLNTINYILRNEKYTGRCECMGEIVENAIPAIIDDDLWNKVKAKREHYKKAKAKRKAEIDYLLTPKLYCGHCGALMTGESGVSATGKIHRYYRCNNRKLKKGCTKENDRKQALEDFIISTTVNQVLTDDNIKTTAKNVMKEIEKKQNDKSVITGLKNELKAVDNKINAILNAIEDGIYTSSTKNRLQELENKKVDLEDRIENEELKKPSLTEEHIIFWLHSFKNGSISDSNYAQNVIDYLIQSIHVFDLPEKGNRKVIITFNISNIRELTVKSSDINNIVVLPSLETNYLYCYTEHYFCLVTVYVPK